ncbi:MAG: DUF1579 domain-containing protein [Planctomycetaceae bacterium]|nr:DUF1579 domain-containing protein [Planctomycetaceae bacterium]
MQMPEVTTEHQWLLKLVGDWDLRSECVMGPDQPPSVMVGKQRTRALGSLWTLGEMEMPGPDGQTLPSLITLGFDPARGKFVGSFITSCMTFHWLYEGSLDAQQRVLTLDAEGPSFSGDGTMVNYQDIIEVVDDDTYLFSSRLQNPDGTWTRFMHGTHKRCGT